MKSDRRNLYVTKSLTSGKVSPPSYHRSFTPPPSSTCNTCIFSSDSFWWTWCNAFGSSCIHQENKKPPHTFNFVVVCGRTVRFLPLAIPLGFSRAWNYIAYSSCLKKGWKTFTERGELGLVSAITTLILLNNGYRGAGLTLPFFTHRCVIGEESLKFKDVKRE